MAETGDSSSISITHTENIDTISAAVNAAADTNEEPKVRRNRMRMVAERKRRNRVKNCFGELRALMPHVSDKSDKHTLVGHAVDYIQSLEKTLAMLENRKQDQALARQVAAEGAASSSSAPPQTAQGTAAAMFSDVPDGIHDDVPALPLQPHAAAVPTMSADVVPQQLQQPSSVAVPAPPPQLLTAAAGHVGFQTWSWPNLVLNVSNDNAYINVCTPRQFGMENMVTVLAALNNHGIDVVVAQVESDAARSMLNIYARVNRMGGENRSLEEVYKLAMSEILLLLNTN